ncbi:hypothetical protein K474DRAFT_1657244 [Panus rudis PR-1116 ss-1]|nr:hypothetical protein K474DRAFT_1657244 [Panus rudis PR-1116 ss-1]
MLTKPLLPLISQTELALSFPSSELGNISPPHRSASNATHLPCDSRTRPTTTNSRAQYALNSNMLHTERGGDPAD